MSMLVAHDALSPANTVVLAGSLGNRLAQGIDAASAAVFLIVVALGLVVIFGVMKVVNMAHGEMFMLGAYTAWWVTGHGVSFWAALILAPLVVGALGLLVERLLIRSLYARKDLSTLLATAGLSIVLQQLVSLTFGSQPQSVESPLSGRVVILGQSFSAYQFVAVGLSLLVIAAVYWLLRHTAFGLRARATVESPEMAGALGINSGRMNMSAFTLGSALAGFGGAVLAPFSGLAPTMGVDFVVRSFLVVIVGGSNAIVGALGGGTVVGGGQSLMTANFSPTIAEMVMLFVVMVLVVLRPQGVFTRSNRRA
jgi:branched-chain amino acid transport system permease protein/urea transport system permease protein